MLGRHILPAGAVENLRLEEDHRVVPFESRSQKALGVRRRGRADHDQAWRMHEVGLGRVAVMLMCAYPGTIRKPDNHRHGSVPTGAKSESTEMADNLVESRVDETFELNFGHRSRAGNRHSHGTANDA